MKRRCLLFLTISLSAAFIVSLVLVRDKNSFARDWKILADNLINEYHGKIISIEQLNPLICWAVLDPGLSNQQAVEIAENIGNYIRNSTGGFKGEKPTVHVFKCRKHIAVARPYGMYGLDYKGKLDIGTWDPSIFDGKYRP